ncbi:MAG: N-ethylmaleimide reductase [Gammaproteobacteria bacterium]
MISEATQISPQGKGYAFTPGIHSKEQIAGWRKVTDAVHSKGSLMFLQLWHVGRISHSSLQPDAVLPVAPSAIAADGQAFTYEGMLDFETPRALETSELAGIVEQHRQAAINARLAGFDGVEIHAANGYLLDQFLKNGSNHRSDNYGGSIENRARLVLEVVAAVSEVMGGGNVGIRISPSGRFNSMSESDPQPLFNYLVEQLNAYDLAYLHVIESFAGSDDGFDFAQLRDKFNGAYIANGGYNAESAEQSLQAGRSDFVSFGSDFIANPDLPGRIKQGIALSEPDRNSFYGGHSGGYTDYPAMSV